jgi:hypothetical protein
MRIVELCHLDRLWYNRSVEGIERFFVHGQKAVILYKRDSLDKNREQQNNGLLH